MPLFPCSLESSAQPWYPKNPAFKGKSKQASCIHARTGASEAGDRKGRRAHDLELWKQTNKQTNKSTPHLWMSASPLSPPSALSGSEYTERRPDQEVALCYLTAGVATVLTFELLWAWQAVWLSYGSSLFCKLTAEAFGLGFPLKRDIVNRWLAGKITSWILTPDC